MEKKIAGNGANEAISAIIAASKVGDEFSLEDQKIWEVEEKNNNYLVLVNKRNNKLVCQNCGSEDFQSYPHFGKSAYQCQVCNEITSLTTRVVARRKLTNFTNLSLEKEAKRLKSLARLEEVENNFCH
jgi:late competence protein required for DNA uptake (superfamily II DNA/RNA helicase)